MLEMLVVWKCFGVGNACKLNASRYFCLLSSTASFPCEDLVKSKAIHLATSFDCSLGTALTMICKNNKILSMDKNDVEKVASFCKTNLKCSDAVECSAIISLPYRDLYWRFHTLTELGYEHIRALNIIQFQSIKDKVPKALNSGDALSYVQDMLSKVFANCPSKQVSEIKNKFQQMCSNDLSLSVIKAELNKECLKWQLNCSQEQMEKLFRKYPPLLVKSLENIDSTLKILTEEYGFTITNINTYPFLLTLQDFHLKNLLKTVPTILGIPLPVLSRKNPAILKKSLGALRKIESVLKDFGSTDAQLACCPKIFFLTPNTLKLRLQALHDSEDFALLKTFRGFLCLVYHYKHLHIRLKLLKESGLPYSLSMFMVTEKIFKERICLSRGQTYAKDVAHYLSEIYGLDEKIIRKRLRRYPNIYCTSVLEAFKVINFLLNRGVSKEQLWNGLGIIAYEADIVLKVFDNLPHYKEFQPFSEWEGHFNLIQLLIYAIERNRNYLTDIRLPHVDNLENEVNKTTEETSELFKEFKVDSFSDSDAEDESDGYLLDSDEENEISDARKL